MKSKARPKTGRGMLVRHCVVCSIILFLFSCCLFPFSHHKNWHSILCWLDLQSYTWHSLLQYLALQQRLHIFILATRSTSIPFAYHDCDWMTLVDNKDPTRRAFENRFPPTAAIGLKEWWCALRWSLLLKPIVLLLLLLMVPKAPRIFPPRWGNIVPSLELLLFEGDDNSNVLSSTSYVGWTGAGDLRARRFWLLEPMLEEVALLVEVALALLLLLEALYAHFPQRGFQQWLVFIPLNSAELT